MVGGAFFDPLTAGPDYKGFTDDIPGHIKWLADEKARMAGSRNQLDTLFSAASQGVTPDQLDEQKHIADLEAKAQELAGKMAHLPREEFDRILSQWKEAGAQSFDLPTMGNPEAPNVGQLGLAAFGSLLDPSNAAKIGATPYVNALTEQKNKFAESVQRYRELNDAKSRNMDFLGSQLNMQDRADRDMQRAEQDSINAQRSLVGGQLEQAYAQRDAEFKFGQQMDLEKLRQEGRLTLAQQKAIDSEAKKWVDAYNNVNANAETKNRAAQEYFDLTGRPIPNVSTETPQVTSIIDKNKRENELQPERVAKVQADVQRTLGAIQLDDARKQQILQRVQYYPLEYQNKAANILSQIEKRKQSPMSTKAQQVAVTDIERLRKIVQGRIDAVKANPAKALDPNVAQTMVRDLAELDRLNQLREDVLNAKVWGDVGGTVKPFMNPGLVPDQFDSSTLPTKPTAPPPGDPRAMQERANRSVARDEKAKKKKVSKESLMRQYGF